MDVYFIIWIIIKHCYWEHFNLALKPLWCMLCYAKSLQSCPTLCDPIDSSPPSSPFPGILQARTLEWVDISFSNTWKWKVKVKSLSHVRLSATPWTVAYQAPPSMGFSRQEYWSGVPLPSPSLMYSHIKFCEFMYVWTFPYSLGLKDAPRLSCILISYSKNSPISKDPWFHLQIMELEINMCSLFLECHCI